MTVSTIAIVGGHGKVALRLIPRLLERGLTPVPLARREDQLEFLRSLGADPRHLDIESATDAEWDAAFEGCDAVVFSAGGGPDGNIERKRTVDLEGSLKSAAAAQRAGIRRFVQVSAIGVDQPVPSDAGEVWAAYVAAKRDADAALRDTDLDWTIIRPGGLTDEDGTGKVTLAPEVSRAQVPRADVAEVVAESLQSEFAVGKQWELVSGSTPVAEAVARR